jgi:hypothetical protein
MFKYFDTKEGFKHNLEIFKTICAKKSLNPSFESIVQLKIYVATFGSSFFKNLDNFENKVDLSDSKIEAS